MLTRVNDLSLISQQLANHAEAKVPDGEALRQARLAFDRVARDLRDLIEERRGHASTGEPPDLYTEVEALRRRLKESEEMCEHIYATIGRAAIAWLLDGDRRGE